MPKINCVGFYRAVATQRTTWYFAEFFDEDGFTTTVEITKGDKSDDVIRVTCAILEKLKEGSYPNVYHSMKGTHEFVDQLQAEYQNSSVSGFTTSQKTRPIIIAKMEEFVRNNLVKVYSSRMFNEFKTFVWNSGRPQAMRSYHDDLIMAFAIGCWVKDTVFTKNQKDIQYHKAMLNSMIKSGTTLNTTIKGMNGYNSNVRNKRRLEEQAKKTKEHDWLFKG